MYRTFESIKNWQRYKCLKIFEIPGGNTPPTKFSRGDTSATLPNRNGRYQGTTCTSWLNFYTPCKSQLQNAWAVSLPYYSRWSSDHVQLYRPIALAASQPVRSNRWSPKIYPLRKVYVHSNGTPHNSLALGTYQVKPLHGRNDRVL